jgi:hypothetical protein
MIVWGGTDTSYKLAKKYNIPIGWGTNTLFDQPTTEGQGKILSYMRRWFNARVICKNTL